MEGGQQRRHRRDGPARRRPPLPVPARRCGLRLPRRFERGEVPVQFVGRIVLRVREVVGERAAVERVAVRTDLGPEPRQAVAGLLPVAAPVQHDRLPDTGQDDIAAGPRTLIVHRRTLPPSSAPRPACLSRR